MKQAVITAIVNQVITYVADGIQGELTLPEQAEGTELAPYALGEIIFINENNEITGVLTKEQIASANVDVIRKANKTTGAGSGRGSMTSPNAPYPRF